MKTDAESQIAQIKHILNIDQDVTIQRMEQDRGNMNQLEKRMEIIKVIVSNLASFENETIKKYILDSICGEINLAYNIGRYRVERNN